MTLLAYKCTIGEAILAYNTEMASVFSALPGQQQPAGEIEQPNPQAVSSNNGSHYSSGSIGPFFAVISVLAVLSILACIMGRLCTSGEVSPLDNIRYRGCLGLVKRKWRWCKSGDVEVGAKVMGWDEERQDGKTKGVEGQHPPQA